MAQILKDEVRQRIVEAAKEEFLEKSYELSSMRSIAGKSRMTVGNLYRYFASKEELNRYIVGPCLNKINSLIMRLSGNQVNLEMISEMNLSLEQLSAMLDSLGDGLVDIWSSNRKEINILMMRSSVNEALVNWFADAIGILISRNTDMTGSKEEMALLAHSYAVSIFEGIKDMLRNSKLSELQLKNAVKLYMHSYVDMLRENREMETAG